MCLKHASSENNIIETLGIKIQFAAISFSENQIHCDPKTIGKKPFDGNFLQDLKLVSVVNEKDRGVVPNGGYSPT